MTHRDNHADLQLSQDRAATFTEVYTTTYTLLGDRCRDRHDLASLAAYRAIYGDNKSRIAIAMERSRPWVRKRCRWLDKVLEPYMDKAA